jgi:tetratricopeptide (TPR) repeat protein
LRTLQALADSDPDRKEWVFRAAHVQRELAKLSASTGESATSDAYLESSIRALTALVNIEESNALWRQDLARSLLLAAEIHQRSPQQDRAFEFLDRAERQLAALADLEPSLSQETRAVRIRADICSASLAANADPGIAESRAQNALENIENHFKDTADPRILELKSMALSLLGREEEAAEIRGQLKSIGFQSFPG